MTFSILIAAYHAAAFLPAALASIAAQTHTDWEVIVVEDGSHDGSEAIVKNFAVQHAGRRVIYDNLGQNRGVAAARTRLLSLAQGDAVAFLDADDLWTPDHLSTLAGCLSQGHALALSAIELWDGDHHRTMGIYAPTAAQIADPRVELFKTSFIYTSSCVALTRAAITRTGGFDETLRIGEDRDYWFRVLADGSSLGCTGQATCRYTKHAGSSMTRTQRVAADTVRFYEKHQKFSDKTHRLSRLLLAEALSNHGRLLRASAPKSARAALHRSLKLNIWQARTFVAYVLSFFPTTKSKTKRPD